MIGDKKKTFRILEGDQTFDIRAQSLEILVRRRYGRTAQIHGADPNAPCFTVTRTDRYGHHIVGKILK